MTRAIKYVASVTYVLDDVVNDVLFQNPDMSPAEAEAEAREVIREWAESDFGHIIVNSVEEILLPDYSENDEQGTETQA